MRNDSYKAMSKKLREKVLEFHHSMLVDEIDFDLDYWKKENWALIWASFQFFRSEVNL